MLHCEASVLVRFFDGKADLCRAAPLRLELTPSEQAVPPSTEIL